MGGYGSVLCEHPTYLTRLKNEELLSVMPLLSFLALEWAAEVVVVAAIDRLSFRDNNQ